MRVLLSDGSGLTARQCATRLAAAGHDVEVLAPDPLCLCRFTRHVSAVRRVPVYGEDPLGWLDAALAVYRHGRFDVLFPTQEQVAVLSWAEERLAGAGVTTVVPPFAALAAVQDKISASATLDRLGLPQPPTATRAEGWTTFPAYVKDPIGTASGGVRRVTSPQELAAAVAGRPVLIQAAVDGPLVMVQTVFDHGSLVAFHATERTAEGANGGASHKVSVSVPGAVSWFETLGASLGWHGALSADLVVGHAGPVVIDVNPRLVEPENAYRSGVDLVGSMMELAAGGHPARQPESRTGVATHQLLLAVLGAAQHGRGRRRIAAELVHAGRRTHDYRASGEESTPWSGDLEALVPVATAAAATIAAPGTWSWFAAGAVSRYALTDAAWHRLVTTEPSDPHHAPTSGARGGNPGQDRRSAAGPPRASRTAQLMAVQRGLESARPPATRLFDDPLAGSFVSLPWRAVLGAARIGAVRRAAEAVYDVVGGPGPRPSAIARTRMIDELVAELAPSVDQVVILGAGYDTRPYRLERLATRAVFEVDRAETQVVKRAALDRAGASTADVTFVPADLEAGDLARTLLEAGVRPDRPTLFLWEGVTQYLSGEAVDTTLAAVRRIGGDGSFLVFTYVDDAVLRGGRRFPEADRWLRGVRRRGEPWVFGIAPAGTADFMAQRGFRLVADVSTEQAGAGYFGPLRRREHGSGLYRVATAAFAPTGPARTGTAARRTCGR